MCELPPVLCVGPDNDDPLRMAIRSQFAALPRCTVKRVPEAGHFVMVDNPAAVAEAIRAFAASL